MELRDQLERTLGQSYSLDRELGGGGMSRVFLATEESLGRQVVVKVLPVETAGHVSIERFRREIRLAASLQQANIVPVLSAGEAAGVPYYTMPFVRGESLRARLAAQGLLPITECVAILRDVTRALAFAHGEGVVHRDIKPENILLSGGTAVVTDFGIAKAVASSSTQHDATLTQMGVALGTPAYMAPEQAVGDAVDHRADIYALGVVAYEMLTGSTPFAGRSGQAMLAAHAMEAPQPVQAKRADVPPQLAALVMRCLSKEQDERPRTASELLGELEAATSPHAGSAVVPGPTAPTIAVLPFANMSSDPDAEFLSDGISEEILNGLARLSRIRVIARTSSFAFKGKRADMREIGASLGADVVLDGSVRRSRSRLRIAAQLIDARTGVQLWSERYDREMQDVFEIQDDITAAICAALRVQLGAKEPAPARAIDPDTYELFLRGRFLINRPPEGIRKGVELLRQVAQRAPAYLPSLVELARSSTALALFGMEDSSVAWTQTRTVAQQVLALDPNDGRAYAELGNVACFFDYEFSSARRHYERALALAPDDAWIRGFCSHFYPTLGEHELAMQCSRQAVLMDPLNPLARFFDVWTHYFARQWAEVITRSEVIAEIDPHYSEAYRLRAIALLRLGRLREAVESAERAVELSGRHPYQLSILAVVLAAAGDRARARGVHQEIIDRAQREVVSEIAIATPYLALDDLDAFFETMERYYRHRGHWMVMLRAEPLFDPVRADPRFVELVRRVGIPEWKSASIADPGARARPVSIPDEKPSIAVLPFANLSPDPADEFFAAGLTDEIITDLSPIHSLCVIARASMMRFKGSGKDPLMVASELGVRYVLDGSVRRAGDSLRLTARLIDSRDGSTLWADKLGGSVQDVFAMQEQVSGTIVQALKLTLSPREEQFLRARPITDVRAFECYLQARQSMWVFTAESLDRAIQLLLDAQKLIGKNTLLLAALGGVHINYLEAGAPDAEAHLAAARECAAELERLDPDSFAHHFLRGWLHWRMGEIRDSIASLTRARELDPGNSDVGVLIVYAHLLAGQDDRARELTDTYARIDPLTPLFQCMPGFCEVMAGRPAAGVPYYRRFRDMAMTDPVAHLFFMWSLCCADQREEAERVADELARRFPGTPFGAMGRACACALRGDVAAGKVALTPAVRTMSRHSEAMGNVLSHVYTLLGDHEAAIDALEDRVQLGLSHYPFLARGSTVYAPLRGHPRFRRLLDVVRPRWERGGTSAADLAEARAAHVDVPQPTQKPTIAVLPLANLSASADDEYFADGMTDDIIAHLSQIGSLKVISRTSVMRYKKTVKGVRDIARDLGATHLVEGSVRRLGQKLRIVTQLVSGTTDEHLWAQTFDRDMSDMFAVQTEVADHIADALRAKLEPVVRGRIARRPTSDQQAYDLFLLARHHMNSSTEDGFGRAMELYQRAVERDPRFGRAWAALARAYHFHLAGYFGMRPRDAMVKVIEYASRALELDPDIAEAHMMLGYVDEFIHHDLGAQRTRKQRAVALSPNNADAHLAFGNTLVVAGRYHEALDEANLALELDPASELVHLHANWLRYLTRRCDEALAGLEAAETQFGQKLLPLVHGQTLLALGRFEEAAEVLRQLCHTSPITLNLGVFALCLAAAGQEHDARTLLRDLHERDGREYVWPIPIGPAYAHLGDMDTALRFLSRSYDDRASWIHMPYAPTFDQFRGHPRFQELARRTGAIAPTS